MKQLLVLSGKGGTGKTTVATAFIKLSKAKAYADCDVDAPNLHLLMDVDVPDKNESFYGLPKGVINYDECIQCGKCISHCRFNAINMIDDKVEIDLLSCEGCGVCELVCPSDAISLRTDIAGDLILYEKENLFSTAKLKMGSGTSGRLVAEVKKQLKPANEYADIAIVDGSPGIGCPVIASLSGADLVLVVAEPSLSGISDMKRIIQTAIRFQVEIAVCVNKADINEENVDKIIQYCEDNKIDFVGSIPYDENVVIALNQGISIIDFKSKATDAINNIYNKMIKII